VGQILGLGVTHFPPLGMPNEHMAMFLERILGSNKVPPERKNESTWPALMRKEWGGDRGLTAAEGHRKELLQGYRKARKALDEFAPDFIVIWGDDQYENFREDIIPPFCVFAFDEISAQPYVRTSAHAGVNIWSEPADKTFHIKGHKEGAKYITKALIENDFDMSYAYEARHVQGLSRAFISTLMFLDYDRKGWQIPIVPFHVNCYGTRVIRNKGLTHHLEPGSTADADPPGPSPKRCFDLGVQVARAVRASPWRVALIASSSWSHAFLTEKNDWFMPDMEADKTRFAELQNSKFETWRNLGGADLEQSGQHEFLNWICLAGAMHELGKKPTSLQYVESYVFNSNKCFAIF
jgi:hypothetical protein